MNVLFCETRHLRLKEDIHDRDKDEDEEDGRVHL